MKKLFSILLFLFSIHSYLKSQSLEWAVSGIDTTITNLSLHSTDAQGNVFVAGQFFEGSFGFYGYNDTIHTSILDQGQNVDAMLAKISSNGEIQWLKNLAHGTPTNSIFGKSIRVDCVSADPIGNIYITGEFKGSFDFDPDSLNEVILIGEDLNESYGFLSKIDGNGNLVWVKFFMDSAYANTGSLGIGEIHFDQQNNLIAIGRFTEQVEMNGVSITGDDYPLGRHTFISKIDQGGNNIWTKVVEGGNHSDDFSESFIPSFLDEYGNIYLSGAGGVNNTDLDPGVEIVRPCNVDQNDLCPYILKLDPDGNYIWSYCLMTATPEFFWVTAYINDIALDADGNIVAVGRHFVPIDFNPDIENENLSVIDQAGFALTIAPDGQFVTTFPIPYSRLLQPCG